MSGQEHAKRFVRAASPVLFIVMHCDVVMHHAQGQIMTLMTMTILGEKRKAFCLGFQPVFQPAHMFNETCSVTNKKAHWQCADIVRDEVTLSL